MNKYKISASIDADVARIARTEAQQRGFKTFSQWLEVAVRAAIKEPYKIAAMKASYHDRMSKYYREMWLELHAVMKDRDEQQE